MLVISLLLGVFFLLPRRAKGQIQQNSEIPEGLILGSRYTSRPPNAGFPQRTIRFEATKSNHEIEEETKKDLISLLEAHIDPFIFEKPLGTTEPPIVETMALVEATAATESIPTGLATCIAKKESSFHAFARNGSHLGVFQWEPRSWYANVHDGLNPWIAADNIQLAMEAMKRGEWWRWSTYKSCKLNLSTL